MAIGDIKINTGRGIRPQQRIVSGQFGEGIARAIGDLANSVQDVANVEAAVQRREEQKEDFAAQTRFIEYEGEMHADTALNPDVCARIFPESRLKGPANLLIMPNANAASVARNLLKTVGGGMAVGPILLGMEGKAHIVTPSTTTRGLINVAALAGG